MGDTEQVRVAIDLSSDGARVQIDAAGGDGRRSLGTGPVLGDRDAVAGPEARGPSPGDGDQSPVGDDGHETSSSSYVVVESGGKDGDSPVWRRDAEGGMGEEAWGRRHGEGVAGAGEGEAPVITRIELSSVHLSDDAGSRSDEMSPGWVDPQAVRARGDGVAFAGSAAPASAGMALKVERGGDEALRVATDALQEAEMRNSLRHERSRSRSSSRSFTGSVEGGEGGAPAGGEGAAPQGLAEIPLISQAGQPFEGLLHCDTTDSAGHPVVVVNTGALPRVPFGAVRARTAALNYIRDALEPVVERGPYVLIFTSFQVSSLSQVNTAWVVSAYRKLTRPFKKNVKFIVLVRPSLWLKALLKVMGMVVKQKARRKVKIVRFLEDMALATGGEVSVEHLGTSVLKALEHAREVAAAAS
eukprot:evm.model.scf_1924.4 EVM.evm.TU.scf_1924.4   scf_1924:17980-20625(-)